MSHNILGTRFTSRRAPGWHEIGTVFPESERISASAASERIGLSEIVVEKRPLLVDLGGVATSCSLVAIVRAPTSDDPEYRIFGTCSEDYGIVQHADLAKKLDPLSEIWPVETVGLLGKGETLFLTLRVGKTAIKGDPIEQFFLLADTKDGATGIRIHFTPVRVVCQNTLAMGELGAVASAKIRHTKNVEAEVDWHLGLVKELSAFAEKILRSFDAIAELRLDDDSVDAVLAAAYAYPRKPRRVEIAASLPPEEAARSKALVVRAGEEERSWETAIARMNERRGVAKDLYHRFNDEIEQKDLAGTGWALYNAVVELEDYREAMGKEDPYVAALFGNRALTKQRAYAEIVDLAGPKKPRL